MKREAKSRSQWLENYHIYKVWDFKFQDLGKSGRGESKNQVALANYLYQEEKGVMPLGIVLAANNPSRLIREKTKML